MLISLYKWIEKKYGEDIALGLFSVLSAGLVVGLSAGLVVGLSAGLISGLLIVVAGTAGVAGVVSGIVGIAVIAGIVGVAVAGIAGIAVAGLSFILIYGLFNLSSLMPISWLSIILFILANFCLAEIIFRQEPKVKNPSLSLTFRRKVLSIIESLIITVNLLGLIWFVRNVSIKPYIPEIVEWASYIGLGIITLFIICLLGYLWLKSNQKELRE